MRILFVSMEYPPDTGQGGIAYNIGGMAPAMVELGHEVHVLSCFPGQANAEVDDRGVHVHRRPRLHIPGGGTVLPGRFALPRVEAPLSAWREARRLDLRPDVVNVPDWMGEGLAFSLARGVPVVSYLHTPLRLIAEHNGWDLGARGAIADRIERLAVRRSTIVTSTSQLLADDLLEIGWLRDPDVRVIPAPVDATAFVAVEPVAESKPIVLVVGRVEARKAQEVVVQAVARLAADQPEVELVLVGRSGGHREGLAYRDWVAREAAAAGVTLTVVDHVDRAEMLKWYGRSRVVVVSSRYESFSIVAVEAAASGRPVICTERIGAREVLGDDPALVSRAGDPVGLAERLGPLLDDPLLAARVGARLRANVTERCAPRTVAAQRVEVYEEAIARERHRVRSRRRP